MARVINMSALRREDGTISLELRTGTVDDWVARTFELSGSDASALAGALKSLSPYGDSDIEKLIVARDSLIRAVEILTEQANSSAPVPHDREAS